MDATDLRNGEGDTSPFCSRGGSKIYVLPRSRVVGSSVGTVDTWGRRPPQWANDGLFSKLLDRVMGTNISPLSHWSVVGPHWPMRHVFSFLFVWGRLVLETSNLFVGCWPVH